MGGMIPGDAFKPQADVERHLRRFGHLPEDACGDTGPDGRQCAQGPTFEAMNMEDSPEREQERGGDVVNFSGLNRKQRRRMAKGYKLFKDRSGQAWRIANRHMKQGGQHEHNH